MLFIGIFRCFFFFLQQYSNNRPLFRAVKSRDCAVKDLVNKYAYHKRILD